MKNKKNILRKIGIIFWILVRSEVYENGIERFFEDEEALFYSEAAN